MNISSRVIRTLVALAVVSVWSTQASAQVAVGQMEVVGLVGGVTDGGGMTLGGGVHYGLAPRFVLAVEAAYLTGGEDFSGFGVDIDSHGVSVDGNVHYLFPSSTNARFTPYVLAGIGYLRASASVSGLGGDFDSSASSTGVNFGGGARWQAGSNWGLRPELKVLVADGGSSVRFAVGFYRAFAQ